MASGGDKDREARIKAYVDTHGKSVTMAFLLALLFGPVGFLYASPLGGVILILVTFGLVASGGPVLAALAWIFAVIFAPFVASAYNDKVRAEAGLQSPPPAKGETPSGDDTMECPFCAETIKRKATVCRYCGRDLPKSVTASLAKPQAATGTPGKPAPGLVAQPMTAEDFAKEKAPRGNLWVVRQLFQRSEPAARNL